MRVGFGVLGFGFWVLGVGPTHTVVERGLLIIK